MVRIVSRITAKRRGRGPTLPSGPIVGPDEIARVDPPLFGTTRSMSTAFEISRAMFFKLVLRHFHVGVVSILYPFMMFVRSNLLARCRRGPWAYLMRLAGVLTVLIWLKMISPRNPEVGPRYTKRPETGHKRKAQKAFPQLARGPFNTPKRNRTESKTILPHLVFFPDIQSARSLWPAHRIFERLCLYVSLNFFPVWSLGRSLQLPAVAAPENRTICPAHSTGSADKFVSLQMGVGGGFVGVSVLGGG